MTKTKSTKRALLMSALSLIMCVSMLIGSTFAWFTDSVTSGKNTIVAGNLDVELYYQNDSTDGWTKPTETSNIFKEDALWEPGHTEVVKLKIVNEGSLALKYQFAINILNESLGINVNNETFKLSDYIHFAILEGDQTLTREEAIAQAEAAGVNKLNSKYSQSSFLKEKGEEEVVTMVVYMPESVGNEANYKTGTTAPTITLGLHLYATQYTHESDSFGIDYDKGASWTGEVDTTWYNETDKEFTLTTAAQLAGLAEIVNSGQDTFKGKTINLGADVNLNNVDWTPIGVKGSKAFTTTFGGSFIGNNHTVSNLYVNGGSGIGFFGCTGDAAHIEGLNINGAYVSGDDYVGAVAGYAYLSANCIKNCTVTNATVIATPYKMADGKYDGGAKAGAIVGYALNGNLTGNTVKDCKVYAYRDLGAIAGMLAGDGITRTIEASNNTVSNVTVAYVGVSGVYGDGKPNQNISETVGRLGEKASVGTNDVTNVTVDESNKGVTMIYTADELIAFANEVNGGNTYANKVVMLGADIDLNNMEWTPIGTAGKIFKGTFDGNGKTVSNLKITGRNSNVGLFGTTQVGEIKNLTVKNALVSGRLNVGVVAGNPYTSKYTNITVSGHVEVNGMSYVGGVGGKNAYANWTDITVNVDETSYVKADSVENGTAYRTYVGGVVGFNGEGGHTFKNITSNIDVIGNVCDIGGVFGIAHYGNKFENVTCSGDVSSTANAKELGGIAGVWNNGGADVVFENCKFTGTVSDKNGTVSGCDIVGGPYNKTGTGKLVIDSKTTVVVNTMNKLDEAIKSGAKVIDAQGANLGDFNYDAKFTDGVTVKNAKFTYFYGGNVEGTVTFENCEFVSDHSYSANFDSGNGNIIFNNCLFDGWSSFGTAITGVEMNNCTFRKTYNYGILRFYQNAELNNCSFENSFEGIDTNKTGTEVHFNNCTGIDGKIFNNGSNVGTWIVNGKDISSSVTAW